MHMNIGDYQRGSQSRNRVCVCARACVRVCERALCKSFGEQSFAEQKDVMFAGKVGTWLEGSVLQVLAE